MIAGIASLGLGACASNNPPVADFTVSSDSGNVPFDVSFILGENANADSFAWDFGDGTGSSEPEPSHSYQNAGTFTIRLIAVKGELSATAQTTVRVEPGEAGWIVINTPALSLSSFGEAQFSAVAYDTLGNTIDNPNFRWEVDADAGEIDGSGKFTAGTKLGKFDGAISVGFERLGVTVRQAASVEVVRGPMHAISIEPNELDIVAGRQQQLTVQVVDEAGHALDGALVLFTALRRGDGINSSGLFKAGVNSSEEDVELVRVEVERGGLIIDSTISGSIRPGILDQVVVSGPPHSLQIGESYQVQAVATDRFGNELELDGLNWTVGDPDIGSVTESGLFTAGTRAGTYDENGLTARAFLRQVEAVSVAPITIVPGPADSLRIYPDGDSVPIGAGSPFEVYAFDAHGNLLDVPEDEFKYDYSTAGRGTEVAVFIAGFETGEFTDAIRVSLPAGVAGNDHELVVTSDVTIRQRSSNIIAIEIIDQDGGGILFIDLETARLESADPSFHNNGAVEISPSWWPDGSRLVYMSSKTGSLQVYTLDLTTREIVQLTDVDNGVTMPEVSPDGKYIALVHLADDDAWQLYVAEIPVDVATTPITLETATLVSVDEAAQHILPRWSPDGSQLLVSQNSADGLVRIMLFDPTNTSEPQVIGPFGTVGFGWTPDGSGIHFGLSTASGALDLGTLDTSSFEPTFIDSPLEFLVAAWAPDDSELMAVDSLIGAAWLLDSDHTGLRRGVGSEHTPTRMAWRPREYGDPVAISPRNPEEPPVMLVSGDDPAPPVGALPAGMDYSAIIRTELGNFTVDLYEDLAPFTVENFVNLARLGFYNGLQFHRVISGFISQTGDPTGEGYGGPGYMFNDEFNRELRHDSAGVVGMANAGSNTNGSQFYISHEAASWLDAYDDGVAKNCADDQISCHTIFGRVTAGIAIATGMAERDPAIATTPGVKILSIEIIES
ncbi:MAG: peptidylprolyl isomerase [Chloroflexi bacterium]|nr:peptidylprolyl isomerase [Chloroflexota bacterium]